MDVGIGRYQGVMLEALGMLENHCWSSPMGWEEEGEGAPKTGTEANPCYVFPCEWLDIRCGGSEGN